MKVKLIIPLLILLISCNPVSNTFTETQKKAVEEEAKTVIGKVFDVLESADGMKRMEICDNSPEFAFVLFDRIYSYDELKTFVAQALSDAEKETFETKSDKYTIIAPGCFTYSWHGKINIFLNSGDTLSYEDYFSTWTFIKKEKSWKMISGHESYFVASPTDNP